MKKYVSDLLVKSVEFLRADYFLMKLAAADGQPLPEMRPGQFVEVKVEQSGTTFLRRPISINYLDRTRGELWLLVHIVGDGTAALSKKQAGDTVNLMFPLGNGFSLDYAPGAKILLVGGGVGTAPLLYYGEQLRQKGCEPIFLLGGRSAKDLLQLEQFRKIGRTFVTTEDGSAGEKGFVTNHSILEQEHFDAIATCGPKPMMMAVARFAFSHDTPCEASLENLMACGIGACLCCVEKKSDGHNVCVCKEGPIFKTTELQWHN